MRIGLVKFLNAHPLDYGLRQQALHDPSIKLIEDIPSRLADNLLSGNLDIALISSVEYLKNKDQLNCISSIGVCAHKKADSLFYIRPKTGVNNNKTEPVNKIWADQGSRSTLALLKILYKENIADLPEITSANPDSITQRIKKNEGGLLIGDAALQFMQSHIANDFHVTDLITWWFQKKKLPFVTALWAYNHKYTIDESLFTNSLQTGLQHTYEIANKAKEFPEALEYLTKTLHYNIGPSEQKSLNTFEQLLKKHALI